MGCEYGGPSCLECRLPACVLDSPFSIKRHRRDARYMEYAKALGRGMTVEEVCRGFRGDGANGLPSPGMGA